MSESKQANQIQNKGIKQKRNTNKLQQHKAAPVSLETRIELPDPTTAFQRTNIASGAVTRPADILALQCTVGNAAVARRLATWSTGLPPIQAKLSVGPVGDKYEQEADRVASQVVEQIHAPTAAQAPQQQSVQRQEEPEEELQAKRDTSALQAKSLLQRQDASDGGETSSDLETTINSARGRGQPLDAEWQQAMGQAMGADFSGVRVHTDAQSDQLNQSIQAKAFTTGQDVFFRQGAYQPGTRSGQELIAHELTHVVQQNGGGLKQNNLSTKKEVQKKGTHESKDAVSIEKIKTGNSNKQVVQRRFGFEIEVPIFFTKAPTGQPAKRKDPGSTTAIDQGAFEVKVDHNEELMPLVSHANQNQNGNEQGFPHGPSILELVTKPMDEFELTETDIRDRAANMVHWVDNVYAEAAAGEENLGGNYYVGSDSPRRTLQSTMGYFQTTYGIKLSSVPALFKETAKKEKKYNPGNQNVVKQLQTSVKAGEKVVKALKPFRPNDPGPRVRQLATAQDLAKLNGYTVLLANYIRADVAMRGGVGLGKNLIGDYFYKTDLGTLAATLPASIQNILAVPAALNFYITKLSEACDRDPTDDMLVEMTVSEWITRVVGGGTDEYIQALKNPYSNIINSEQIGPGTNQESGIVMENREPQNLDRRSKQKRKRMQREQEAFHGGGGPAKTQQELQDFLRDMTDPKKYPSDQWESMMLMIYRLLREING